MALTVRRSNADPFHRAIDVDVRAPQLPRIRRQPRLHLSGLPRLARIRTDFDGLNSAIARKRDPADREWSRRERLAAARGVYPCLRLIWGGIVPTLALPEAEKIAID